MERCALGEEQGFARTEQLLGGLDRKDFDLCMAGIGIVALVSILQDRYGSVRELVEKQNLAFRWIVYFGLFLSVLIFGCYGPGYDAADFIYGGF